MTILISIIVVYLLIAFFLAKFMIGTTHKPSTITKLALIGMALAWPLLPLIVMVYVMVRKKKNEF